MHRFFINKDNVQGKVVRITGSDFNHISHSLRLVPGDRVIVNSGDGVDNTLEIIDIDENRVKGKIIYFEKNKNEPELNITLAQAIPKKHNMDMVVQKCTEIGIKGVIPIETKRTIVKLKNKKRQKRINRWQRIAEEAAKQSGRGCIPRVMDVHNISELTEKFSLYDLILIPWVGEESRGLKEIWNNRRNLEENNILIIIGPEGGFTADEVELVREKGGKSITLGPRVLRTETAGLVVLTMILYEAGEMGGEN